MPTISRDAIQIVFTARDRVSGPLRTATRTIDRAVTSSAQFVRNMTALGARRILGGIRSLGSALGSLTGIGALLGGGGLSVLVGQGLAAGDQLAKTADRIGATTEELGRLNFAFSQTTDLTDTAVNTSLQRLQKRLGDFALNGVSPAAKALETLGLDANVLTESGLENSVLQIADALSQVENSAEQVKLVDSLFGKEGVGLINGLRQGSGAITALGDDATALGITFERELLRRNEEALDQFSRMADVVRGTGIAFSVELAPRITDAVRSLEQWIVQQGGVQVVVDEIITASSNGIDRLLALSGAMITVFDDVRAGLSRVRRGTNVLVAEARVAAVELAQIANIGLINPDRERELEAALANAELVSARARQPEIFIQANLDENQLEGELGALSFELSEIQSRIDGGGLGGRAFAEATAEAESYRRAISAINDQIDLFGLSVDAGQIPITDPTPPELVTPQTIAPVDDGGVDRLRREQQAAQTRSRQESERLQREAVAEQRRREREQAQSSVTSLAESFDERLRIQGDFNRAVAELNRNAALTGLDRSEVNALEGQLDQRRLQQLEEFHQRERDLADQALEDERLRIEEASRLRTEQFNQRETARDFDALVNFDTSQSLQQGLDEIQSLFLNEIREINVAPNIPLEERQRLIQQAQQLKADAEAELQVNATLNLVQGGLQTAGNILGAAGSLQGLATESANERFRNSADEQKAIQADLLSAIQSGNQEEVASLEQKLSAVNSIRAREEVAARKQFERNKRIQQGIAVVNTIAGAVEIFRNTPGELTTKLSAMAAGLAAGFAQVAAIQRQRFGGSAGVSGAGGGSSTSGGNVTDQQLNDARNQANTAPQPSRTVNITLPNRRARFDSDDIQEIVDGIEEGFEDQSITTNIRFAS